MITPIHVRASTAAQQAKKGQVSKCCRAQEALDEASASRVDAEPLQTDKKGRQVSWSFDVLTSHIFTQLAVIQSDSVSIS